MMVGKDMKLPKDKTNFPRLQETTNITSDQCKELCDKYNKQGEVCQWYAIGVPMFGLDKCKLGWFTSTATMEGVLLENAGSFGRTKWTIYQSLERTPIIKSLAKEIFEMKDMREGPEGTQPLSKAFEAFHQMPEKAAHLDNYFNEIEAEYDRLGQANQEDTEH